MFRYATYRAQTVSTNWWAPFCVAVALGILGSSSNLEAGEKLSKETHELIPGVGQLEDGSVKPDTLMFDFTGISQQEDLPELTAALEEIIAKYPSTCFVYAWLAGHYGKTHHCEQLQRLGGLVLQHCTTYSLALTDIGESYVDCQDVVSAEQFLKKAIEANPDSGARPNLARLYGMTKRNELCIQEATDYISREAKNEAPGIREPLAQAYNVLGVCLVQLGKAGESFQWFEAALKVKPNDPLIQDNYQWAKEQVH